MQFYYNKCSKSMPVCGFNRADDQDRLLLGLNLLGLINLEAQLPGTIEFYQNLL